MCGGALGLISEQSLGAAAVPYKDDDRIRGSLSLGTGTDMVLIRAVSPLAEPGLGGLPIMSCRVRLRPLCRYFAVFSQCGLVLPATQRILGMMAPNLVCEKALI